METLIQKIVEKDATILGQYNSQVANLIEYRKKLSVEHIANDLKNQLNSVLSFNNRNILE